LRRGGGQTRWHSLVNCNHGDSSSSRFRLTPRWVSAARHSSSTRRQTSSPHGRSTHRARPAPGSQPRPWGGHDMIRTEYKMPVDIGKSQSTVSMVSLISHLAHPRGADLALEDVRHEGARPLPPAPHLALYLGAPQLGTVSAPRSIGAGVGIATHSRQPLVNIRVELS
jgi:hypothetical protein